jgi:nucleoid-associated protein YgaU
MGLFDFASKAGQGVRDALTGGGSPDESELRQTLTQNGITIQNLDLDVKGDTVRIAGIADTNAEREKAILVLGNRKDVDKVEDSIQVLQPRRANLGTAQQTTAATTGGPTMAGGLGAQQQQQQQTQAQQPRTPDADETRFYRVQPGDTLSKIAQQHYGEASKYNQIFEANRPMLKDPDHIYPGQMLRVPPEQ